ncbi:MAG: hypothetical protein ACTSUE_05165, partial [Promethearchaeota archaeon]
TQVSIQLVNEIYNRCRENLIGGRHVIPFVGASVVIALIRYHQFLAMDEKKKRNEFVAKTKQKQKQNSSTIPSPQTVISHPVTNQSLAENESLKPTLTLPPTLTLAQKQKPELFATILFSRPSICSCCVMEHAPIVHIWENKSLELSSIVRINSETGKVHSPTTFDRFMVEVVAQELSINPTKIVVTCHEILREWNKSLKFPTLKQGSLEERKQDAPHIKWARKFNASKALRERKWVDTQTRERESFRITTKRKILKSFKQQYKREMKKLKLHV